MPPRLALGTGDPVLDLVQGGLVLEAGAVHEDADALDEADGAEEEVDGGEEVVLGGDDEAPAGPDQAGGGQGAVLLEGELLGGAGEVGDAGEDEGPLHDGRPEVDRLEADGAVPHPLEPARGGGALGRGGLPPAAGRPLLPAKGAAAEGARAGEEGPSGVGGGGGGSGGGEERPRGAEEGVGGGGSHGWWWCCA